jgi:GNAT superfamily N-acetyltransferase
MEIANLRIDVIREGFDRYRSAVVRVYKEAYSGPPYFVREDDVEKFAENDWQRWILERGFLLALAWAGMDPAGMSFGWSGDADAAFSQRLLAHLGSEAHEWLEDSFILVDLAVRPVFQGKGIGACLHDTILDHAPHRTALLYTLAADTPALRLYFSHGWTVLRKDVTQTSGKKYYLMGHRNQETGSSSTNVLTAGPQ